MLGPSPISFRPQATYQLRPRAVQSLITQSSKLSNLNVSLSLPLLGVAERGQ